MCSAEVLVFAEALRRRPVVVGARPSGPAGVCRRLFAAGRDADPVRVARGMEEELRRQMSARWNFDFEREAPLPGRYQWVSVGATPAPAHKQQRSVQEVVRTLRKPSKKSAGAALARQHKITEFMKTKKRPLSPDNPSPHKLQRLSIEERVGTTAGPT